MTDTNVIPFPATTLECDANFVLEGSLKEDLEMVLILGQTKDGEPYFVSSTGYFPEMLWHLERAVRKVHQMADECTCCDPGGAA